MAADTPFQLSKKSQSGLVQYFRSINASFSDNSSFRDRLRDTDLAYQREQNWELENRAAKIANRYGASSKFQDVTVPVVMPQVETAVTYQASVFLSGNPMFGVISQPKYMDAALQLESVIDNQALKGKWVSEFLTAFKDGFKHNLMAVEVSWDKIVTAAIDTDLNYSQKVGKPKQVIWEGNTVKQLDLYNTIWDTRVAPKDVSAHGEFAGYDEVISRIVLKQLLASLPDKILSNVNDAFESASEHETYYTPEINPDSFVDREGEAGDDWLAWVHIAEGRSDINYSDKYLKSVRYARILPADFDIRAPAPNTPQVWKFILINNSTIVYAERQTNAHELIPIIISSPLEDGLAYQTKSFAENVAPIQQVTSALMNSVIAARRRAISDRTLYDPTLVNAKDINNPNPTANIPVKARAYNKSIKEAVYPFPFNDSQSVQVLQEIPQIMRFADSISGQNQASQGQFTKGNRTRHEYADIMASSNGRNKLIALTLEANFFSPIKEILKLNILQYQGTETIYSRDKGVDVDIDPVLLRQAVTSFKISDGLVPTDTLMGIEAFQAALQTIMGSPELASGYTVTPMFSYLMKTQGADIAAFEKPQELVQYEQAIGAWQQTVMSLVEANPEITQEQYPPQPLPTDFGMDEKGNVVNNKEETSPTIMQQVIGANNAN